MGYSSVRGLAQYVPAVNIQSLTGDVSGVIGSKEDYRPAHIFRGLLSGGV